VGPRHLASLPKSATSTLTRRRRLRRFLPTAATCMDALRARIATRRGPAELAGLRRAQAAQPLPGCRRAVISVRHRLIGRDAGEQTARSSLPRV
jgi:hypothetical protein